MGYWNSRGLRGSGLEEEINYTNEVYARKNLAIMQKIPTPITPVEIDREKGNISRAYFDAKSTVDYIGAAQGIPICFDAKEVSGESLPLRNIHEHQVEFMNSFQRQGGIAFLLVFFKKYGKYFFLPCEALNEYWTSANKGGRKSIPYRAFDVNYEIKNQSGVVNYLEAVNTYLMNKGN